MYTLLAVAALSAFAVAPAQETVIRAYLGIDGRDVPKRGGMEVVGTDPGSPATHLVRVGDVVLSWEGLPTRTADVFFELVERHAPGDRVTLEIRRNGERLQLMVELADAAQLCQEGIGSACVLLAGRYSKTALDDAYTVAAKLYERACELGSIYGCSSLGILYSSGRGVPQDRVRSTTLLAKACEAEVSYACLSLGEAYLNGEGVEADTARGVELLKWSCDHDQPYACLTVGTMYQTGRNVPEDRATAAEFYRVACKGGWTDACDKWWYLGDQRPEKRLEVRTFPQATPELNGALFRAVESRDLNEVRRLLAAGADPNVEGDMGDLRGVRLIIGALFLGELEIVHALLDAGADVHGDESNPFQTPLTAAIARGDLATVHRMLELGAPIHSGDLGQAASSSSPEVMRRLMQEGITIDDLYLGSMPAILTAARHKRLENIDFLVAQGADIDALENEKHSALTYVLEDGDTETAAFLLSRGADPNMTNGEGRAPLHYAAGKGLVDTVKLLLEHGADPDNVDDKGMSVLQLAVMVRQVEVVRALIEGGASAGKLDPDGVTPLMYAAALGDDAICEILLKGGAPVNIAAKKGPLAGKTAIDVAILAGWDDVAARLRAAGADDPL